MTGRTTWAPWMAGWVALAALSGCSGSDSTPPGGTGGAAATGGSGAGGAGGAGAVGGGGAGGATGTCPPRTSATQAVHIAFQVTWPGSIGTEPGSGTVHVWTRSRLTYSGSSIAAVNSACGTVIPDITKTPIAGGGKVAADFLPEVWDAPTMPTFPTTGTQSGWDVGSTVTMEPTIALVGTTMSDPLAAWPPLSGVTPVDHDGDGKPGITSTPRGTGGYSLPPLSLLQSSHADQLYIASRTTSAVGGTRQACDRIVGTATVYAFNNHIVGCRKQGGGDCSASEYQFVDDNRTVYQPGAATYESVIVADDATCADVRGALPM
ncbi:MAG: hypothetical protein IT376_13640 [Polyangiaceae bacterium]|nr:hypothetical protein [Polyangiaceae bacterium]